MNNGGDGAGVAGPDRLAKWGDTECGGAKPYVCGYPCAAAPPPTPGGGH
jgi:hypothetical protein